MGRPKALALPGSTPLACAVRCQRQRPADLLRKAFQHCPLEMDIYAGMDTDDRNPSGPPPIITALRPSPAAATIMLRFPLVRNPKASDAVPSSVTCICLSSRI